MAIQRRFYGLQASKMTKNAFKLAKIGEKMPKTLDKSAKKPYK